MDILDIDEILKDDSYIFLADKTHDDISNILQQWKTNNQPLAQQQQLHYNNEQAYKLNSKTFTRPKRRTMAPQNLDPPLQSHIYQTPAMLNLEIGGLVTNMHKSFLQDTSPPSSISSSTNNERMNNSLITSADFTNLNFLQSTQSLEFNMPSPEFNLSTKATETGYTLGDMIRDRKTLESLTMSGDGTLIKDSHIGQIDDISLTLSKTASGYSTMDNSTDSISTANEFNNRTVATAADRTLPVCTTLQRTMVLSEEMIGDTTFNLVDSMTTPTTDALPAQLDNNDTFKKPAPFLDQTQLLASRQVNITYTEESDITEARCETPENVDKQLAALQIESSTPLTTGTRTQYFNNNNINRKQYTPTLKSRNAEEINLSPIVGTTPNKVSRLLNNTYEPVKHEPSAASFDGNKFVMETMELLEQIEQPLDGTYNASARTEQEKDAMLAQHKQMQCVMDLAEAEVELLAQQGDEEQFEHMLAELGKVNALNAEQLKMRKSLESIKRRFTNGGEAEEQTPLNVTQDLKSESQTAKETSCTSMLASSQSHSNSSGERLLSRRSRLYDDVNLNAMQASNNGSGASSCNSTSFIVQRREDEQPQNTDEACTPLQEEVATPIETEAIHATSSYKLNERRERDRERFKTIRITKEMRDEKEHEIVVPCIDDDYEQVVVHQQQSQQRLSRREQAETAASNYLTYKKPKEKSQLSRRQLPEATTETLPPARTEPPRSLSRPRYISGLQKFTTVSKATSAGAGLNATHASASTRTETTAASGNATSSGELKSPMGIKSKSFHNLSSNISGGATAPRASFGGLRRPMPSKLMSGLRAPAMQQQEADESSVFKVPKLVNGSRAPANALVKRSVAGNGLARPSSGYYSLSVAAKASASEAETPESLSSASSRGSLYGKDGKQNEGSAHQTFDSHALSTKLTQTSMGATGIPKPSGLRQPTQMKRSGLPRPSSVVRR